jgi:hypothetical protein
MTNFRRYDVRIEAGRTDLAFATFLIKQSARACFAPIKKHTKCQAAKSHHKVS